ncbi:taurine dioxygenase [Alcanivorax sp. N3-2A]|nr:taurine dioxygenase [Alcanivorax sp. N3-2A]|tara:strand:- start:43575 stop:44411 length:837 start_codon:yes stop_codon:yes gene_type:complete
MSFTVTPSGAACGASIAGIDLARPLSESTVAALRRTWLEHKVLAFVDQDMNDDDLERFSLYFGQFAGDPYIASMEERPNIIELRRTADETSPIFADAWHTDWSFGETPPAATLLYGITIPPHGGDTDFINQEKALAEMPASLRQRLQGKMALHSAQRAYAPDGLYGKNDADRGRGFKILTSDSAYRVQPHPIIRAHPETGREALFGCIGYVLGFQDMDESQSMDLLMELYHWQTREEFQYHHHWQPGTLVIWDNRSVLHKANGGYEGYERVLHRTVIK